MDLEEKENPREKIDGNEKTDLQIEDTGKDREDFRTLVESVRSTCKWPPSFHEFSWNW